MRRWLRENGTSVEYGARELKRTIHRHLTQPLAAMVSRGQIEPGSCVYVGIRKNRDSLTLGLTKSFAGKESGGGESPARAPARPIVLLVEGNSELLRFQVRMMEDEGWEVLAAGTADEARKLAAKRKPQAALVDAALPDERGVNLAVQLCQAIPSLRAVVTTTGDLPAAEDQERAENGIAILEKPFLGRDLILLLRSRLVNRSFTRLDDSPKAA